MNSKHSAPILGQSVRLYLETYCWLRAFVSEATCLTSTLHKAALVMHGSKSSSTPKPAEQKYRGNYICVINGRYGNGRDKEQKRDT